ncbi:hypothetical protein NB640_06580 [Oxalobacter vibrioformis]|uniref:Lipoprotein n=1 Tax=Oxalobacter vibrioformis TaxID=933080 RepID=A0A9E9LSS8_9BURK|nr:hypothetical protein [Oxalobacter vibrioformis]WAW08960.1 hypothetical protein NB640_06580 [Oxalobacter vibrioformis]
MKKLMAVFAVIVLSGCATTTESYEPPKEYPVESVRIFNASFDTVWKRLVKNLSKDFFVINNIEKSSHIINVSFSSDRPSDYVDCGTYTITTTGFDPFTYKAESSSTYDDWGGTAVQRTRLEGRVNIYVAPEKNKTEVTVSVKYVLPIDISVTHRNKLFKETQTYSFSSKQKYSGNDAICYSKGVIERSILDMAGK